MPSSRKLTPPGLESGMGTPEWGLWAISGSLTPTAEPSPGPSTATRTGARHRLCGRLGEGHRIPAPPGSSPDQPGGQRHLYSVSVSRSQVPPLRQGLARQAWSRGVRHSGPEKPRRQPQT